MEASATALFVIFGLGNPGWRYRGTRHNIGYRVVDELARRYTLRWRRRRSVLAAVAERGSSNPRLVLVKPLTYVNRSGVAAKAALEAYGIGPDSLVVAADDINLPLGRLRLRARGSHGGHNGLRSIIEALQSEQFARCRVGVGQPEGTDAVVHVLGRFRRVERTVAAAAVNRAADAIAMACREGLPAAMNRFNPANSAEQSEPSY